MLLQNRHLIVTLCMAMVLTGIAINPNSAPAESQAEQRLDAINTGIERSRDFVVGLVSMLKPSLGSSSSDSL
jgi:hypothetical protein